MLCGTHNSILKRAIPSSALVAHVDSSPSSHADTPIRRTADTLLLACRGLLFLIAVALTACSEPANQSATADVDYWTCAMHPSVHSQTPGKCPICGMDLVPVTHRKEESPKPAEFIVPLQRQQQIGVTYAEVRRRHMQFDIRSVGTLEVDQARIFECVTRVDGLHCGIAGHFTRRTRSSISTAAILTVTCRLLRSESASACNFRWATTFNGQVNSNICK